MPCRAVWLGRGLRRTPFPSSLALHGTHGIYALEFQIFNNSIRKLALNKCSGLNVLFCAVSDLLLLTFVTIFSLHFLFGDMDQFGSYFITLLKFLITFRGILTLALFWCEDSDVACVDVRGITL